MPNDVCLYLTLIFSIGSGWLVHQLVWAAELSSSRSSGMRYVICTMILEADLVGRTLVNLQWIHELGTVLAVTPSF